MNETLTRLALLSVTLDRCRVASSRRSFLELVEESFQTAMGLTFKYPMIIAKSVAAANIALRK